MKSLSMLTLSALLVSAIPVSAQAPLMAQPTPQQTPAQESPFCRAINERLGIEVNAGLQCRAGMIAQQDDTASQRAEIKKLGEQLTAAQAEIKRLTEQSAAAAPATESKP